METQDAPPAAPCGTLAALYVGAAHVGLVIGTERGLDVCASCAVTPTTDAARLGAELWRLCAARGVARLAVCGGGAIGADVAARAAAAARACSTASLGAALDHYNVAPSADARSFLRAPPAGAVSAFFASCAQRRDTRAAPTARRLAAQRGRARDAELVAARPDVAEAYVLYRHAVSLR